MRLADAEPWKPGAAPMAWAGDRVYFNRRRSATAPFEGWSAKPDGTAERLVTTAALYPKGTQHGIADVSPDGRHVLVTAERPGHWPFPDGWMAAAPGRGAYNDLWIQPVAGRRAWKIRDLTVSGGAALLWPRFDSTGRRVVWAEQWEFGLPFGRWRLHVGRLMWTAGVPTLTVTATRKTQGLVEPYGILPDGRVLLAADALAGTRWDNLQLLTLPASLKGAPTRLSPRDAPDVGSYSNHNEFCFPIPGADRLIFARSVGAFWQSMEYWTMRADGSDPEQLTALSVPGSPHYRGWPSIAGGLAFDPANPKRLVAGFATSYEDDYKSMMLTLE